MATIEEIESSIETMKVANTIEMERLQTICDAVSLAGEQVQDKRIEWLKDGPELTAGDILIDVLVSFVCNSSIAERTMRKLTMSIAKGPIRKFALVSSMGDKTDVRNLSEFLKHLKKAQREEFIADYLSASDYQKYRAKFDLLLTGRETADKLTRLTDSVIVATNSTYSLMGKGNILPKSPALGDCDSPGVGLRRAVYDYARKNRLYYQFISHRSERFLRAVGGGLTAEMLELWISIHTVAKLAADEQEFQLSQVCNNFSLVSEAIIWAKLFRARKFRHETHLFKHMTISGQEDRVVSYWIRRFGRLIQNSYNSMTNYEKQEYRLDPYYINDFYSLKIDKQVDYVLNYLKKLDENVKCNIESMVVR